MRPDSNGWQSFGRRPWCSDVLTGLGDYLDGELPPETVAKVEQDLTGCPNCKRFGADMAAMLSSISNFSQRTPADVSARLRRALSGLESI